MLNQPQLDLRFEQTKPMSIYSPFGGRTHPLGTPAAVIVGHSVYRIVLTNPSNQTPKSIALNLSIKVDILTRPDMDRVFGEFDEDEFETRRDIYCLVHDETQLPSLEFWVYAQNKSEELSELIELTERQLNNLDRSVDRQMADVYEEKLIELKGESGFKSSRWSEIHRHSLKLSEISQELLDLYHRNPARDIYTLEYEVHAEGFAAFRGMQQLELHWKN